MDVTFICAESVQPTTEALQSDTDCTEPTSEDHKATAWAVHEGILKFIVNHDSI